MKIGVTGTPGTGKTTFSKLLASRLKYKYFNLEDFIINNKLYLEYDDTRGSYVLDLENAYKIFKQHMTDDTIYEGLSLAYLLDNELFDYVILLRCNPYELENRLREKGFSEDKIRENVQAEILDVVAYEVYSRVDRNKVIQIDNSSDLNTKVEKALNIILNKTPNQCDKVDWLGLIAQKGDIKKFLE